MRKNNFFGILATVLFFISSCTQQNLQPSTNSLGEIKVKLELTKFRVNNQLGNVTIDYATRNVVVFVPYNYNLANTMITEIESSSGTEVVYNGSPVVPNTMIDFTVPRLFLVQSKDGKTTSQWTVRVTPLTVQAMTIPDEVAAPVINAAMKTITVEFQYGAPKETPVTFTLPMGASTSITEPIDLVAPVGAFQKSTTFDLKVNGYTEQWTLITTHRVRLNEVGSVSSPNGETTGWSFTSMTYVNDQSNPADADIIAYYDVTDKDIDAAAGGLDQTQMSYPSINKTRFMYYNNAMAGKTFFQTGTLGNAKSFFAMYTPGSSTADPNTNDVNGFPSLGEVYILKLDNGKYALISFPEDRVNTPNGYFSFNYRLLE